MHGLLEYLIPNGPFSKALRRRLKQLDLRYKVGYLGMLMDENYAEALAQKPLLYRAEHLKKLDRVDQNPEVVDIAFEVLEEVLHEKNIELPTQNKGMPPYQPSLLKITFAYLLIAAAMTGLITLAVIFIQNIAWMTTLIIVISILGMVAFIASLNHAVIYVDIEQE